MSMVVLVKLANVTKFYSAVINSGTRHPLFVVFGISLDLTELNVPITLDIATVDSNNLTKAPFIPSSLASRNDLD